ncbi:hypothetical protein COV58_02120 [Candidatus Roizmanbacteria bacterium CG11_big_fil_rev_8_21_14_0_20_36_8]|uniref:Low affinity iron permease family protein n=2 Tax=Candidatus Roizmaniibacteriota TaxID=1752723 RepID=A0A2M6IUK6_9BACT|nr:MAG: hypothetical protein COV58_02120 [Candidatus Roizmanbacteria bacterium CG11_big_fil_rev_8_21_14_0_20_36_8]PIZ65495.1 MAG: low affinity iron permease family protein [Candidatus Roizmanbacteria bacterium CG_4_10_14_0_2_um_filter_36_9]
MSPESFRLFAQKVSQITGNAKTFLLAAILIAAWMITGPIFNFSDTWQLVINTSTTIITFLMVFIIQNTQNRDARATQLKLDELIRATRTARNIMVDLENLDDKNLEKVTDEFHKIYQKELDHRKTNKTNSTNRVVQEEQGG